MMDATAMHALVEERSGRPASTPPAKRARTHARRSTSLSSTLRSILVLTLWVGTNAAPALAQTASKDQMRSLDEQVQEIKSDVLGIATELGLLEEKLLYPSNTQVAVFVSLANDPAFQLDSVQIRIDGELVAHHIYSFKELEALGKGGVQRIYTGNVTTGDHQLEVSVDGKGSGGDDIQKTRSFSFAKEVEPKLVEINLAGHSSGDELIQLGSR